MKLRTTLMASAMAVAAIGFAVPAQAADVKEVQMLHWWTSGGEAADAVEEFCHGCTPRPVGAALAGARGERRRLRAASGSSREMVEEAGLRPREAASSGALPSSPHQPGAEQGEALAENTVPV